MNTRIAARRQFIRNRAVPLTIGFTAIADFSSFIGQEYIAGIMSAANDYGVNFINMADATRHSLFVDAHFLDEYLTKFSFMRPPLLDGLVTWASTLCEYMDRARVQELFTALKPLPMVDIGYLDIPGVPSIRVDNKHSMHLLVDHLVHIHGFKRLAFMGSSSSSPHISRMECFKQELASCGLAWDDSRIFMAASIQADSLQEEAQALLRRFYRDGQMQLDAVVTSSDIIASALIAELEKEGISVPEDLAVTGFNNQYSGITAATPVTTIDLVYFKRGYEAVERLLDRIMGLDQDVETHRVKTSLVVRQSCGCFEKSIVDALNCDSCSQARALPGLGFPESDTQTAASRESDEQSDQTSENDVRSYLTSGLKGVFSVPQEKLSLLVDGIIADIYETTIQITPPLSQADSRSSHILTWFRALFKANRLSATEDYEEQISALRRIIMPLVRENLQQRERMENICHALRALHSVFARYDLIARKGDAFSVINMTNIALNFTGAASLDELEKVLRFKLGDLAVPGIVLVLSPFMQQQLGQGEITTVIPDLPEDLAVQLPLRVREGAVFPKRFFPAGRHELTLVLLCNDGLYMGYAFIRMGSRNMALYDNIKELLSQTLYNIYLRDGRIRENALVVQNRARLKTLVEAQEKAPARESGGRLSADELMNYLIDHLDEMTDLDKIADHFHISTSHLARRAKALTGYSVQVLHERLKIEQAKDLIKNGSMKMLDIASRLGFSNPNYFSNVFKKVTGESPRAWASHNRRF